MSNDDLIWVGLVFGMAIVIGLFIWCFVEMVSIYGLFCIIILIVTIAIWVWVQVRN